MMEKSRKGKEKRMSVVPHTQSTFSILFSFPSCVVLGVNMQFMHPSLILGLCRVSPAALPYHLFTFEQTSLGPGADQFLLHLYTLLLGLVLPFQAVQLIIKGFLS